jgi:hypothetical protein
MKKSTGPWLIGMLASGLTIICSLAAWKVRESKTIPTGFPDLCCAKPKPAACPIRTILDLEPFDTAGLLSHAAPVAASIRHALDWLAAAQASNGGWGAGSYYQQEVLDPHAVETDPATTALVGMSLLRCGHRLDQGEYAPSLRRATDYLLHAVEGSSGAEPNITSLIHTQPQIKLGQNIDVILTAQYFSNLMRYLGKGHPLYQRIERALDKCIGKIQRDQDQDGSWKKGGWAPVLQSALANNALESAQDMGIKVDSMVLKKSRDYQKSNFDPQTDAAVTGKSAGVLLYAISGSSRASAKESRIAKEKFNEAVQDGKLKKEDQMNEENLVKAGMTPSEAKNDITAYHIHEAATIKAQSQDVMNGFGSNGGEEFISYLMTGESLVMNGGQQWIKWYELMTARLIQIQNQEGCWSGHHCITSPVFCTATCLLVLSIDNDIEFLARPDKW